MGKNDIKHTIGKRHHDRSRSLESQKLNVSGLGSSEIMKRTEAELKLAVLTASGNPMAFHDFLSPSIRSIFPDSKIASTYHSASTKATCMLNLAVAPTLIKGLLESMRTSIFTIIDGSSDTGLEKMNPLPLYCTILTIGLLPSSLTCLSTSSCAEGIFCVLESKLAHLLQCDDPWKLCTSVGVNNLMAVPAT